MVLSEKIHRLRVKHSLSREEDEWLPYIAGVIIFIIISNIVNHRKSKVRHRQKIRRLYGQKPKKRDYDFKEIGYHWQVHKKDVPEDEKIDDISWNDLEMDKVYQRINNCRSFIGDQVLYSKLHCLPMDSLYGQGFEKSFLFLQLMPRKGRSCRSYFLI